MEHFAKLDVTYDDTRIAKMVEERAAEILTAKVREVVGIEFGTTQGYYYQSGISDRILAVVRGFLEDNKDYIIQEAAKEIANRVMRSKKSREAVIEKVGEETE